jgi:hypothetical protein
MPNKYGVNFGISLSVLYFKPTTSQRRDIELGFNDENEFPHDFIKQEFYPLKNNFFVRNNNNLRLHLVN